jgi:hypothetical protein
MDANVRHIERMLEMLLAKTKQPNSYKGFKEITAQVRERQNESMGDNYVYENLFRKKESAKEEGSELISVQIGKLDAFSRFLDFRNYQAFCEAADKPLSKTLKELSGSYYSYVRRNDNMGILLRSPVRITEESGEVTMELKGGASNFKGRVELEHGCLFVLLKSGKGKMIHHVYKIGNREKPQVLQGIFSGVSTAFDPIGGRVVLVRREEEYEQLRTQELRISELKKDKTIESKALAAFFATYESNNLSVGKIATFSLDDLLK